MSLGFSYPLVHINKRDSALCFFSGQEKLGSYGFRQLSCIFLTAAARVLSSADHYQHQHLALLACFQTELNFFLRFQKQEIPCERQWNLGLNISKTNCCFYKTSWSDGLLYEFFLCNSSLCRTCCEISKVPCFPIRLRSCVFIHFPKEYV